MPSVPVNKLAGTVLGFDYGNTRIGVAVGQTITRTASPLPTLPAQHGQPDWNRIAALVAQWQVVALVVGLPANMDGTASEMTAAARRFARQLEGRFALPVHLIDERLSSRAAEERLADSNLSKKRRHDKGSVDAFAAQIILETWLNDRTSL